MNNSPMFSIIIPVYNVENELARCIESIINQTMHNFEVILVDDGSPDNCPQICDEYAEKYNYITVIHKENGGVSSARNAGIKIANGKYIWFIDSDDYIEPNSIEVISSHLKDDVDFLEFNVKTAISGKVENFSDFIKRYQIGYTLTAQPWDKIYKTSLIRENNIQFDVEEKIGEDQLFNVCYYKVIKNFVFITDSLYHYVYRATSAMHTGKEKRTKWPMKIYNKKMLAVGDYLSEEVRCALFIIHLATVLGVLSNSYLTKKERKNFLFEQFRLNPFSKDAWKKGQQLFFERENASFLGEMRLRLFLELNRRNIKIMLY